jgi:uncharacterized membrane protein
MQRGWVFLHVLGAFGFVGSHGVAASVTFALRRERQPARIRSLLALSRAARPWMYMFLLLLVGFGIVAASDGGWWSATWLWVAIGLFVVLVLAAFPLAIPYFRRVRLAVAEDDTTPAADLDALLRSPRPIVIAVVETAGLVAIIWLMVAKPVW